METGLPFFEKYLRDVLSGFVDHPEAINITPSTDLSGVLLMLTVHPDDMGKVIGKSGKMATQTLRPLMHAVGLKHSARVSVKINEPVGGKRDQENKTVDQVVDELS